MILITEKIATYLKTYHTWRDEDNSDPLRQKQIFNACFKMSESFTDKERIDVRKILTP